MQNKVDKLISILNNIKSNEQKGYAINLLADIVNIINNQENEIIALNAWKTDNKVSEIECELEKYVLLLISYGYTQRFISTIRTKSIVFVAKNKGKFGFVKPSELKNIDLCLMNYELDNNKFPENYNEFIKYYNDASKG